MLGRPTIRHEGGFISGHVPVAEFVSIAAMSLLASPFAEGGFEDLKYLGDI